MGKPYALATSGNPKLLKTDLAAEPCKETNPTNEDDGLQIPWLATEDKKKVSTPKKTCWLAIPKPPPNQQNQSLWLSNSKPKNNGSLNGRWCRKTDRPGRILLKLQASSTKPQRETLNPARKQIQGKMMVVCTSRG